MVRFATIFMYFSIFRKRRIGPEKGVIHIAFGAVDNALWDMYARSRGKPLWKLIVDMTPVCAFPKNVQQDALLMTTVLVYVYRKRLSNPQLFVTSPMLSLRKRL